MRKIVALPPVVSYCVLAGIMTSATLLLGQTQTQTQTQLQPQEAATKTVRAPAFFESLDLIEVTLTTNIGKIRGDKGDDPPWRPATLTYKGTDGSDVNVPLKARTRGIWRLKRCDFPPMRLNFSGETSKGSIFHRLDKPKL